MKRMIVLAAAAFLLVQTAFAHAFLDHASPAVGSQVAAAPSELNLIYTEPVEPLFSSVHVTNASGTRMDDGKPNGRDDGRGLRVSLKEMPPGVYTVEWHVTSVDTHKTNGHFTFTVKP